MEQSFQIATLISKFIRKELSEAEIQTLSTWRNENTQNEDLFQEIITSGHQLTKLEVYQKFNTEKNWKNLEKQLGGSKTISFPSRKLLRYAAAILLPLFIAGGISFYFLSNQSNDIQLADVDQYIKPGSQKAVLILSDGAAVNLNNEVTTIEEDGASIENIDNTLNYQADNKILKRKQIRYNELRTPSGGTYNLKLADGTEVWLNSGSVLKFPVEFTDSVRTVYLTGEGYFDVTHTGKAFIVKLASADVRVLGTSFNISAYSDEESLTTTLVEGKVAFEVSGTDEVSNSSHILEPGLQAVLTRTENEVEINKVNTAAFTSWKEGKLEFSNEALDLVMKKMARWYNFEYTFENDAAKDYHFTARFNRNDSISTILEMLELTTNVEFKIENNTIVIL